MFLEKVDQKIYNVRIHYNAVRKNTGELVQFLFPYPEWTENGKDLISEAL